MRQVAARVDGHGGGDQFTSASIGISRRLAEHYRTWRSIRAGLADIAARLDELEALGVPSAHLSEFEDFLRPLRERADAAEEDILATPATSWQDLRLKAECIAEISAEASDGFEQRLTLSLCADIAAVSSQFGVARGG